MINLHCHTTGWDVAKHNIHRACEQQIQHDSHCPPITFPANNIVFSKAYVPHAGVVTDEDIDRAFFRIECSQKIFNRIENTQNLLLRLDWKYIE
jgi:hypothetical protein